jgi:hypothetical protein
MSVYLKSFFHQLGEITSELVEMFPDDPDFKVFQTYINMLKTTNPGLVVDSYYDIVKKFDDQINARNDDFFLNYNTSEYGQEGVDIVAKIKLYWSVLSEESKKSIWDYIYILKELAKKYKE